MSVTRNADFTSTGIVLSADLSTDYSGALNDVRYTLVRDAPTPQTPNSWALQFWAPPKSSFEQLHEPVLAGSGRPSTCLSWRPRLLKHQEHLACFALVIQFFRSGPMPISCNIP